MLITDPYITFCHSTGGLVEVLMNSVIVQSTPVPAFDHLAPLVVAYPFSGTVLAVGKPAGIRFLINIFALCNGTLLYVIQPVPCICGRIIDLLATVIRVIYIISLTCAVLIPVENTRVRICIPAVDNFAGIWIEEIERVADGVIAL